MGYGYDSQVQFLSHLPVGSNFMFEQYQQYPYSYENTHYQHGFNPRKRKFGQTNEYPTKLFEHHQPKSYDYTAKRLRKTTDLITTNPLKRHNNMNTGMQESIVPHYRENNKNVEFQFNTSKCAAPSWEAQWKSSVQPSMDNSRAIVIYNPHRTVESVQVIEDVDDEKSDESESGDDNSNTPRFEIIEDDEDGEAMDID